jgi:hypothetical protein
MQQKSGVQQPLLSEKEGNIIAEGDWNNLTVDSQSPCTGYFNGNSNKLLV